MLPVITVSEILNHRCIPVQSQAAIRNANKSSELTSWKEPSHISMPLKTGLSDSISGGTCLTGMLVCRAVVPSTSTRYTSPC